jgi:Tfp pilus assembly protein PilX
MIDILAELAELETFIRKETRISNVSSVSQVADSPGISCHIDHGNIVSDGTGKLNIMDFQVYITLKDVASNWKQVLKSALIIQENIGELKDFKWQTGDIERVESVSEYIIKLSLSIKVPYV